jgi:hypothetical protein
VPFTPDEAKPPLLDDIAEIQKQQALWVLLGATAGPGAAAMLGPVGLVISGVAALLVYVLEINKIDVDRALNDPPRPDFAVRVRARRRRFDPSHMQSPIELAAGRFADGVLDLSAYLEAAVRADERAQTATRVAEFDQQQARLFEGQRATARAAEAGERVARDAFKLADALASDTNLAALLPVIRRSVASRSWQHPLDATTTFSPEALAYVRRTTLATSGLTPTVRVTESDAEAALANPLDAVRVRAAAFAGSTLVATGELRRGYGQKDRLEGLRSREQPRLPQSERSRAHVEALPREADQSLIDEARRRDAARRWLNNFVDMYAGLDTGEGDPVHVVRERARAFLEAGPTEHDPFRIAEQIALALPGDPRAAALAASWREELRRHIDMA